MLSGRSCAAEVGDENVYKRKRATSTRTDVGSGIPTSQGARDVIIHRERESPALMLTLLQNDSRPESLHMSRYHNTTRQHATIIKR